MTTKKKAAKKSAKKVEWNRNRGKQPVADSVWVEVRLRSGEIERSPADEFRWNRMGLGSVGDDQDIMVWRRIRKPRSDKGTKVGIPAHKSRDELVVHNGSDEPITVTLPALTQAELDQHFPATEVLNDPEHDFPGLREKFPSTGAGVMAVIVALLCLGVFGWMRGWFG